MDLARLVTHLLRECGETRPAPLLGGVAGDLTSAAPGDGVARTAERSAVPSR